MAKAITEIRSLARSHTGKAIRVLVGIMRQETAPPAARVAAANAILDRGWGKAQQHVAVTGELTLADVFAQIAARSGDGLSADDTSEGTVH